MPSLKDQEINSSTDASSATVGAVSDNTAGRQQPVALEVPILVNGARALEGSEKREPFSESSRTVLVFGNGAVIRLASAVAPGQLLFVTNQKTKKEVICQVVKSKSSSNASGYVEVAFTEPVSGFWGLRFPSGHSASRSDPLHSPSDFEEYLQNEAISGAPRVVAAKLESPKVPIKSVENQGSKTELKTEERASNPVDLMASTEAPVESPKLESNRLQEQLSALLLTEQNAPAERTSSAADHKALSDTTAKLFEMAEANSFAKSQATLTEATRPGSSTKIEQNPIEKPTLKTEEVKVPSWLEPLARTAPKKSEESPAKSTFTANEQTQQNDTEQPSKSPIGDHQPAKVAPVFGNTLLGQAGTGPAASQGSSKGLLVSMIAAGVLVAAAGTTWYLRQSPVPLPGNGPAAERPSAVVTPSAAQLRSPEPAANSSESAAQQTGTDAASHATAPMPEPKPASTAVTESSSSGASSTQPKVQPAVARERVPQTSPAGNTDAVPSNLAAPNAVEPDTKRPGLGKVRLAKPKISRKSQAGGVAEPALAGAGGDVGIPANASLTAGLVLDASSQPAAPGLATSVGSDVKPARLLSSVPPAYPALAKNQHVAGDVRIDALIDSNGRVSSMKVISGPTLLHAAAMDALRQWKYQPATLNGNPVPMHLTVTIQFHLQ